MFCVGLYWIYGSLAFELRVEGYFAGCSLDALKR